MEFDDDIDSDMDAEDEELVGLGQRNREELGSSGLTPNKMKKSTNQVEIGNFVLTVPQFGETKKKLLHGSGNDPERVGQKSPINKNDQSKSSVLERARRRVKARSKEERDKLAQIQKEQNSVGL